MDKISRLYAKKPIVKRSNSSLRIQRNKSSQPQKSPTDRILFLQRTIGNQAVQRLIKSGALQAKLRISQPGDVYEQEADRVADAVMQMPESTAASGGALHIQRACPSCEEEELRRQPIEEEKEELQRQPVEEKELQAKATSGRFSEVNPDIESHILSLKGGGKPLPENNRAFFEPQFGHDFRGVRVHTNTEAIQLAQTVNAKVFTVGQDVIFGKGQHAPETSHGRQLMAHELTHVLQQRKNSFSLNYTPITRIGSCTSSRSVMPLVSNTLQMVPLPQSGSSVRYRCGALGCPLTISPPGKTACAVINCGRGSCPICPPGFENLVWRAWCSYSCLPSGSCFMFFTAIGNLRVGPFCFD